MTGADRIKHLAPWCQVIVREGVEEGGLDSVEVRCIRCGAGAIETVDDHGDGWIRRVVEFQHADLCLVPRHMQHAAAARWN
jgi:hypothetical protein